MLSDTSPLTRLRGVQEFEDLRARPLAIVFKHSTACPVSAHARDEVRSIVESVPGVLAHEVYVIEDRELSLYVASATGILHQSPQVLVFRNGEVVWHDSHFGVRADAIASALGRAERAL